MIGRSLVSLAGLNVLKGAASIVAAMAVAAAVPPDRYGLVAFAAPLATLIGLVTELGLTGALVRRERLSPEEAGTAILAVDAIAAILSLAMATAAGLIEGIVHLDGLSGVIRGFAVVAFLSMAATIRRALLERRLAYRDVAAAEALALAVGCACCAAALAMRGGVLALVAFQVGLNLARLLAFRHLARGLYRHAARFRDCADLFAVGGALLAANLFNYAARNLDNLLIGAAIGSAPLGLYAVGYQVMTLPLVLLAWPATGLVLSGLSRLGPHSEGRRRLVAAVLTLVAAAAFPAMTFVAIGSRFPVGAIYGDRWAGLPEIVAWLAPLGALQSVAVFNGAVLLAAGQVRTNLAFAIGNGTLVTLGFAASVPFGLKAAVVTYCITGAASSAVALWLTCRVAGIGAPSLLGLLAPGISASLGGVAASGLSTGWAAASWLEWGSLTLSFLAGALAGLSLVRSRLAAAIDDLRISSAALAGRMPALDAVA